MDLFRTIQAASLCQRPRKHPLTECIMEAVDNPQLLEDGCWMVWCSNEELQSGGQWILWLWGTKPDSRECHQKLLHTLTITWQTRTD